MSATGYLGQPAASRTSTLFGQVMALVALTVAMATLGAWLGRNTGGAEWFIAWLLALGCLVALNVVNARGNTGLAVILLLVFGLLMGGSVASTVNYYAATDPTAVRQAFGATALFVAILGAGGYAVRRDLSFLYRFLFWALLALLVASLVLLFVHIPSADLIWSVLALVIFGLYTVVDFNRLRRAGTNEAVPLAAGIFLDVLNIFLIFLRLFGRSN
jgi:FtsH-binding integral membrane protein